MSWLCRIRLHTTDGTVVAGRFICTRCGRPYGRYEGGVAP